jgi:GH43 family beta-xylosidase
MMQRTSIAAQIKVAPKVGSINAKVYDYFVARQWHGATDQELEAVLHLDGNTIRPSRGSLVKKGLIRDSGNTRKNNKGNDCIVWVVAEEGMLL